MAPVLVPSPLPGVERESGPPVDPEALIEQARTRQRRRRRRIAGAAVLALAIGALAFGIVRLVSAGGRSVAESTPKGLFVNRAGFAGHGVLAFVSRGRLFVLDGKTGKLSAVTAPGRQARDPLFSPNGAWLTYTLGAARRGLARIGLARSDGSSSRTVSNRNGGVRWLPDGDLLMGSGVFRVATNGVPVRVGSTPSNPAAWSPDGDRFAFVSRSVTPGRNGAFRAVDRLQVASSLTGRRATWHAERISFTRRSGVRGNAIGEVVVLPDRRGILFWVDPEQSSSLAADGMSVYGLRAPGARPVKLAFTVGEKVSTAPAGALAVVAGGNRYAWLNKNVETCSASTWRCAPLPRPAGALTIDPAWSPDGKTLVFVEAARGTAGDFSRATVAGWYSTHRLWLLEAGAARPTEIPGTEGAAAPSWSSDGKSLLYVSGDAIWLIPKLGRQPEKIVSPLYAPGAWPSSYGRVDWTGQFAWSS